MAFGDVVKAAAGIYLAVGVGGYGLQQWSHECSPGEYPAAIGSEAVVKSQLDRLRAAGTGEKTTTQWYVHAYLAGAYPVRLVQQVVTGGTSLSDFALARKCVPAAVKKMTEKR